MVMAGLMLTDRVPVPPSGFVTVSVVPITFPPDIAAAVNGTESVPFALSTTVPTVSSDVLEVTATPVANAPLVPGLNVSVAVTPAVIEALGEAEIDVVPEGPAWTVRLTPLTPVPPFEFVTVAAADVAVAVALTLTMIAVEITETTVAESPDPVGKVTVAPGRNPEPLTVTVTPEAP
jgi:hypothetical protein